MAVLNKDRSNERERNKREHLEQFADGLLYCNSLGFLSDLKNTEETWFDADEGIVAQYQPDRIKVSFTVGAKTIGIEPSDFAAPLRLRRDHICVFCMYAVYIGDWNKEFATTEILKFLNYMWIRPRIHELGEYVAVVLDPIKFHQRIEAAVAELTPKVHQLKRCLVQYVDLNSFHGAFPNCLCGCFKSDKFSDEREYRFLFNREADDHQPFRLKLGSLRDIVKITTWLEARQTMKLRLEEGKVIPMFEPKRFSRRVKKRWKK